MRDKRALVTIWILILTIFALGAKILALSAEKQTQAASPAPAEAQSAQYLIVPRAENNQWYEGSGSPDAVATALNRWLADNPEKEIVSFSADHWGNDKRCGYRGVWIVYRQKIWPVADPPIRHRPL